MAEFLSDAWIAELDGAARDAALLARLGSPEPLVVEQRVRRGDGDVVYHVSFGSTGARVRRGPAAAPDLVLVTDVETARRLQQGTLTAHEAAVAQQLKIRGRVGRLRTTNEALVSLDDVFQTVRDATTYPAESEGGGRRRSPR